MLSVIRARPLAVLPFLFATLFSLTPVAQADSVSVSIQGFAFHPPSITVPTGSTITWTNQDSAPHTATANDGSFDTGTLKQGQAVTIRFSKAGTYAYVCQFHPFMHGTVIVTAAPAAAIAATTTTASLPASANQAVVTATTRVQTAAAVTTTVASALATTTPPQTSRAATVPATAAAMPLQMPATGSGGSGALGNAFVLALLLGLGLIGGAITSRLASAR